MAGEEKDGDNEESRKRKKSNQGKKMGTDVEKSNKAKKREE